MTSSENYDCFRDLHDALSAQRIEMEDLRKSLFETKAALGLHHDSGVADCVEKIREMKEALKWYASPPTWNQWLPNSAGDRARKAL